MTQNRKRPGKKTGSTVPDRPVVSVQLPECPHCKAIAQPTNKRYKREIVASGQYGGRLYGKVTIWSASCSQCSGPMTVIERSYIADEPFAADANRTPEDLSN